MHANLPNADACMQMLMTNAILRSINGCAENMIRQAWDKSDQ